jgi:Kelch motif
MWRLFILLCLLSPRVLNAQWSWTALAPLPMPTANHALCAAEVNGAWNVYVFGGITTGLSSTNIHRSAFRYVVNSDTWFSLPDVPDTLGKIASSASVVGDTAYVIGGYHVFNGAPFELSSNKVHRLNLTTNTWMPDGAPVPVPIDDHVQCVWRDSLIYVITGWSNTTNVPNVQVYDPAHDTWGAATPVPDNSQYKAFGAGGVIIGDTIVYHGGASTGGNFPAQDRVRIGAIDPVDPLTIAWLPAVTGGQGARYRSAPAVVNGKATWIGGSATSYNFDALAYAGGAVVDPATGILQWNGNLMGTIGTTPTNVMDLRAAGDLGNGQLIVAGGIGQQRAVLDSVWLVSTIATRIADSPATDPLIYPDPFGDEFFVTDPERSFTRFVVFDALGAMVMEGRLDPGTTLIPAGRLRPGTYLVRMYGPSASWTAPILKIP